MNLKNKIYKDIREGIVFGKLTPGERLPEVRLGKKFECSRGPVREALVQLDKEGFVELVPNQGAVVTRFSPQEIEDFYSLLEVLEGTAVQWAVPILTSQDIEHLTEINNSLRNLSRKQKGFIENWISQNLSFHEFFRDKCGNEKLKWVVEEIRLRITRYRYTSLITTTFDAYIQDHDNIIEAVHRKDAQQAKDAMERHICRAKKVLMDFMSHVPSF